jgi:hypothetical protein
VTKWEDYRAKALECEERALNESRYEARVKFQEWAQQWRALAEKWERLAQSQADMLHLRSRRPLRRFSVY